MNDVGTDPPVIFDVHVVGAIGLPPVDVVNVCVVFVVLIVIVGNTIEDKVVYLVHNLEVHILVHWSKFSNFIIFFNSDSGLDLFGLAFDIIRL